MTESSFREIEFSNTYLINVQVRSDKDGKKIFIGTNGTSVIIIPYDKLDEFVDWLITSSHELNDQLS